MGVVGLWRLLTEVGELQDLTEPEKTLAVDLSAWICQAGSASCHGNSSASYFIIRTIFYRTLDLLKSGVKLIFVLDGVAPSLKLQTLKRRNDSQDKPSCKNISADRHRFKERSKEVVRLLQSLGVPVVESPGEAEKMCAYLNATGVVDAVVTEDGDALLYGAKEIYRNCSYEEKTATSISMSAVEDCLQFDRESLIAFALLSGCDLNHGGVKGIGPDHIQDLFHEMRQHDKGVLERICGWEEDEDLQELSRLQEQESVERTTHCSQCNHTGNIQSHRGRGCNQCKTDQGCQSKTEVYCNCTWHSIQQRIDPYKKELSARRKALKDPEFTGICKQIKEEFMDTEKEKSKLDAIDVYLTHRRPNLEEIVQLVSKFLRKDKSDIVAKLVPVFVNMQLRENFSWTSLQPLKIEKTCKRNHMQCYQTTWSKIDEDKWTCDASYSVVVEKELLEKRHPDIVSKFKLMSAKKPQNSTPSSQRTIHDMFPTPSKVRKLNRSSTESQPTPNEKDSSHVQNQGWKKKLNFDTKSVIDLEYDNEEPSTLGEKENSLAEHDSLWSLANGSSSGKDDVSKVFIETNNILSHSQELKSSGETDVHSLVSEDLFPSDHEDDTEIEAANTREKVPKSLKHNSINIIETSSEIVSCQDLELQEGCKSTFKKTAESVDKLLTQEAGLIFETRSQKINLESQGKVQAVKEHRKSVDECGTHSKSSALPEEIRAKPRACSVDSDVSVSVIVLDTPVTSSDATSKEHVMESYSSSEEGPESGLLPIGLEESDESFEDDPKGIHSLPVGLAKTDVSSKDYPKGPQPKVLPQGPDPDGASSSSDDVLLFSTDSSVPCQSSSSSGDVIFIDFLAAKDKIPANVTPTGKISHTTKKDKKSKPQAKKHGCKNRNSQKLLHDYFSVKK